MDAETKEFYELYLPIQSDELERIKQEAKSLEFEKSRWANIMAHNKEKGIDRMRNYLCSRMQGRKFGEDVEEYFYRIGFASAAEWIRSYTRKV